MIYSTFQNSCRTFANEVAITYKEKTLSYQELAEEVDQFASGFSQLNVTGNVGIMLPNIPEFITIAYGLFASGNVVTPLSVMLTANEIKHAIEDSKLALVFVHHSIVSELEKAIDRSSYKPTIVVVGHTTEHHLNFNALLNKKPHQDQAPSDDSHCLTLYTSGSTGASKGVMLSSNSLIAQANMLKTAFAVTQHDRVLCTLPLFHAYGLNALVATALLSGANVVLQDRFRAADSIQSLTHDGITIFAGVPTMYTQILDYCAALEHPPSFPKLRACLTGGAPMDKAVLAAFEREFNTQIYEGYGLTETTVSVCSNTATQKGRKLGSVGQPYEGVAVKVITSDGTEAQPKEIGELLFKGPNIMLGYQNLTEDTNQVLKQDWLYSGDLGYVDEDGFCFIVGRKKDLIIKSGYNIFPKDVEDVLKQVSIIRDAVVFGVPDRIKGEIVVAAVIPTHELDTDDALEQISATLHTTLAKYKHPNVITFCKEFPVGHTGKVLKHKMKASYLDQPELEKA